MEKRELIEYRKQVRTINTYLYSLCDISDEEFKLGFKAICGETGAMKNSKLIIFAYVVEAIFRVFHIKLHNVQILSGLVLSDGKIAEMATGEGKTLMSTLPAVWFALKGKGVHIMTVNEYLAKRDYTEMKRIYEYLGLTVGLNIAGLTIRQKQSAYQKEITYGVCSEFGFDYLKDQLVINSQQRVQRSLSYVIVDEIDSLLIDEAKTPLIIANHSKEPRDIYYIFARFVQDLRVQDDYEYDEEFQQVMFTEKGIQKAEKTFLIENLYDLDNVSIYHYLLQSLRAKVLMKRDVHYIVSGGKIELIDAYTGRVLEGRQLNDGLHQAIEAKEQVTLSDENKPHAMITIQKFFKLYDQVVGMSGTIMTEEEELYDIYGLTGFRIPTNKPILRTDEPDRVFLTKEAKLNAVAAEVRTCYLNGQPILIGTASISSSEEVAAVLEKVNIPFQLLNAKTEKEEAEIISKAGQKCTVTIATNMAGRGTDICLGDGVSELGGLYVIGTEHHESRRIDNQLRGRTGRQGDVGKSRFFVSLEDEIVERFAKEKAEKLKARWKGKEDAGLKDRVLQQFFIEIQTYFEKQNFEIRSTVNALDSVVHDQRMTFYSYREDALYRESIYFILQETISAYVELYLQKKGITLYEEIDLNEWMENLGLPVSAKNKEKYTIESLTELKNLLVKCWIYWWEEAIQCTDLNEQAIRGGYLKIIDEAWVYHLEVLQHLKGGIHYRALEQRNPLLIYNDDAWKLYRKMEENIQNRVFNWSLKIMEVNNHVEGHTGLADKLKASGE